MEITVGGGGGGGGGVESKFSVQLSPKLNNNLNDLHHKHMRSILEYAAPVWHSSLTNEDRLKLNAPKVSYSHIVGRRVLIILFCTETNWKDKNSVYNLPKNSLKMINSKKSTVD